MNDLRGLVIVHRMNLILCVLHVRALDFEALDEHLLNRLLFSRFLIESSLCGFELLLNGALFIEKEREGEETRGVVSVVGGPSLANACERVR